MPTLKIRQTCKDCLDKTGTIRVRADLFGYRFGQIGRDLRIGRHIKSIRGHSINLCVFLLGLESGFSGTFTRAQALRTQHAIDLMREIYRQADLGVRKVYWRGIGDADAAGFLTVDASGATDLTEEYSGPGDAIDLFMVQVVSDAGGWSNSAGPCDKSVKGRTGAVVEVNGGTNDWLGVLVAHEVGHYLTLGHANAMTNLMGVDSNGDGIGELSVNSRNLTSSQINEMKASCWVREPC